MPDPVLFYFEFASPYGYLASERIDALAAAHGREVVWRPVMLGAMLKRTGSQPMFRVPLKADYAGLDLPRFARLLGLPFVRPPTLPMNSLVASRAFWWLADDDPATAKRLAQAVFRAHWGEGRDLGTPEAVAEVAGGLGVDSDALTAAVARPEVKERLKAETAAAESSGVFGSPFIIVDGELFWGADRLDQVELWLRTGGW